jgi:hypothetical protein
MVHDPAEHEALTSAPFEADPAQAFIVDTVRIVEALYDAESGWPLHPEDDYGDPKGAVDCGVYFGTAGSLWALARLAERYGIGLQIDPAREIMRCEERFASFPEVDRAPSYFMGQAGVAFVRYLLTSDVAALERCMAAAAANAGNPTREWFWGSPGTVAPALLLRERDDDHRFDSLIRSVQDELWQTWETEGDEPSFLWLQDMYGKERRFIGAGHGAVSNIAVFLRASDLLSDLQQAALPARIRTMLERYAIIDGDAVNWWNYGQPNERNRMQWCHGAPGIITSLARLEPTDDALEDLLRRGGDAAWQAGPLAKGPTLCHGTAGNGFAFLELARRTGDEVWLDRAQQFAIHAMQQCYGWRQTHGIASASLWTGDLGVALYVDAVLRNDPHMLSYDIT